MQLTKRQRNSWYELSLLSSFWACAFWITTSQQLLDVADGILLLTNPVMLTCDGASMYTNNVAASENWAFLGSYAASMVISYRRFGTTYRSHLKGRSIEKKASRPRENVGGDKFLVVWCQLIGFMKVDGVEGASVVVSAVLRNLAVNFL